MAEQGDPAAYKLPRPLLNSGNLDFSFAGLKTAVLVQAQRMVAADLAMAAGEEPPKSQPNGGSTAGFDALPMVQRCNLAASTQAAIVDVLVKKSMTALNETGLQRLVVAGGVGANRALREQLNLNCAKQGVRVHYPELHLCTDNGAMIAMAAAMRLQSGLQDAVMAYAFDVKPRWPLDGL
jgi:N6-L-threonylcarbamoyladenine synthase